MRSKPSLLIVDHDPYLAALFGRKFEAEGWKVTTAESLSEARKAIKQKTPSVILFEPDMDAQGAEAFVEEATTPVVILTTMSEREEIQRLERAGAAAYLLKGHFVPHEVVAKVKSLLK